MHLAGGLGNQMFQYAFGLATAKRLGVLLALELSSKFLQIHNGFELENVFKMQAKLATADDLNAVLGFQRYKVIRRSISATGLGKILLPRYVEEAHFHFAPRMMVLPDNIYISGYWQSERYFQAISADIRSAFSFEQQLNIKNALLVEKIRKSNSISLHVRRNDYVNNPKVSSAHGVCSLHYYHEAIRYMSEKVSLPQFFIFSDDIAWAKENLKFHAPCFYVNHNQGNESHNDMRLMSLCQHHIIANSSFSWWGAWLGLNAEKIVVGPKNWFVNSNNIDDLFPHGWVKL